MRLGIIAEGKADVAVIKAVLKALRGIDGSEIVQLRPRERYDETDLGELDFSNWKLVLDSCGDECLLSSFFDGLAEEARLVVQIDTAERGESGYDVARPPRTGGMEWKTYSEQLYGAVKERISRLVPEAYREKVAYAIAVEETDAWLIPLFEPLGKDTAGYAAPKERLKALVGKMDGKRRSRYVDTGKKNLNYAAIGKEMRKGLRGCRQRNRSLDLFCVDVEAKLPE